MRLRLFLTFLIVAFPLAAKVEIIDYPLPRTMTGKPTELVAGTGGAMWFIDSTTQSICRIDPSGAITEYPVGLADSMTFGADGAIWYTQSGLRRIYRLDPVTGTSDSAIYVDNMSYWPDLISGPDGNLWLVSGCADRITRVSLAGVIHHFPTTAGGCPYRLAVGPDGNIWFTEHYGSRVGRITTSGVVTEFASPASYFGSIYPDDITAGPDGNLWYTSNEGLVTRITPAGVQTQQSIPNAQGAWIAAGPDGNLWLGARSQLQKVSTNFQVLGTVQLTGNAQIRSVAKSSDGKIWAAAHGTSIVARLGMDGALTEFEALTRGGDPHEVALGPDGNIWFTELNANKVGVVTPGGEIREYAIPTPASKPKGITRGTDGAMWFVESTGDKVGRITMAGAITEHALPAGSGPSDIVQGPDGNFWITLTAIDKIARMTPDGVVTEFPLTAGRKPGSIIVGPDSKLWFTENVNRLGRMGVAGDLAEFSTWEIDKPAVDLTIGPDGHIWYTDRWSLLRMTTGGQTTFIAKLFNGPQRMVTGPDGAIWMTSPSTTSLIRYTPEHGAAYLYLPIFGTNPLGLAFGADGNLWVAQEKGRMGRVLMTFDGYSLTECYNEQTLSGNLAKFADLSGTGLPGHYSASISWGDGSPSEAGTIAIENGWIYVRGTHTYAATPGARNVTVTITDLREPEHTATVTSKFTPKPAIRMTITGAACPDGTLTASVPDLGPGATYQWSRTSLLSTNGNVATYKLATNGLIVPELRIEVTVSKSGYCNATATRRVTKSCGMFSDANGDGRADVLWRAPNGENAAWEMNGFTKSVGSHLPSLPSTWTLAAHADFTGDGRSDIFWRDDTTGANLLWIMNGATRTNVLALDTLDPSWKIAGIGDFDFDGVADVLWRRPQTGENAMWCFSTGGSKRHLYVEWAPPVWKVAGVGKFDDNLGSDILWRRDDTGENAIWMWNLYGKGEASYIEPAPPNWKVAGVADFDADGRADILWRDPATGANAMWLMHDFTKRAGSYVEFAPPRWTPGPVSDFDGDGRADIFWRDDATGENAMWLMNGFTKSAGSYLEFAPPVWRIFRPQ